MNNVLSQSEPRTLRVDRVVGHQQVQAACSALPGFVRMGLIVPDAAETLIAPGVTTRMTVEGLLVRCVIIVRREPAPVTTALAVQMLLTSLLAQGGEPVAAVDVHIGAIELPTSQRRRGAHG